MSSKLEIFNIALQHLGLESVTSVTGSIPANSIASIYNNTRKGALSRHNWNFATKRVSLTANTTIPEYKYAIEYTLPSDFIRLVTNEDEETSGGVIPQDNSNISLSSQYSIEIGANGNKILCSNNSIERIFYVFDQLDEGKFSPLFSEFLGVDIASKVGYKLTHDIALVKLLNKASKDALDVASMVDAQQDIITYANESILVNIR